MNPVYSLNGGHVAWLGGGFVYNTAGNPIGYTSDSSIFSFDSLYIGQLLPSGLNYLWRGYNESVMRSAERAALARMADVK